MNDQPARLAEPGLQLFGAASSVATATDTLFVALLLLCGAMALLLAALVVWLCVRYRAGAAVDRSDPPSDAGALEATWIVVPLLVFLGIFAWAARDFLVEQRPPPDALPIHVVGKQWMWKLEHGSGRREINELHVPQGRPVELILASEDAIHSFYLPAFRLKQDAVPGRVTHLWFTATRLGQFRLFCSEFCGSEHAGMVGKVTVMSPAEYARWLDAGPVEPGTVQQGFALYRSSGCSGCHDAGSTVHAPMLQGLYGRRVQLQDGRSVTVDESYLRDSIVLPGRDVVAGFAPIMPSYAGQLDETQLQQLVAYLRAGAPSNPSPEALR